ARVARALGAPVDGDAHGTPLVEREREGLIVDDVELDAALGSDAAVDFTARDLADEEVELIDHPIDRLVHGSELAPVAGEDPGAVEALERRRLGLRGAG